MRMNLFRKLMVTLMLAWLPLSGAIAAVMPIARALSIEASTAAVSLTAAMPCHDAATPDDPGTAGCTHCVLCHLAVSLMLPYLPVVATPTPTHRFAIAPLLAHASFIPEPLSPPPRHATV